MTTTYLTIECSMTFYTIW